MIFSRAIPPRPIYNDIILQRLPLELVYEVIDLLDIESVIRCTEVSKTWCKILLHPKNGYRRPWRDFSTAYEAPSALRILPKVLEYIKMLSLPGEPRAAFQCMKLLKNYPSVLPNIQSLEIWVNEEHFPIRFDNNPDGSDDDDPVGSSSDSDSDDNGSDESMDLNDDDCLTITNHLTDTLRTTPELQNLKVVWSDRDSKIFLGEILSTCIQLRTVYLHMQYAKNSISTRLMPAQTLLTRIELGHFPYYLNSRPLFENSPALRYLRLFYSSNENGLAEEEEEEPPYEIVDILPIIHGCCPRLEVLITEPCSFEYTRYINRGLPADIAEINDERPRHGLRFLWLHCFESASPLLPRLEQSQQSLEALYFTPMENHDIPARWDMLSFLTLPKLTYLNIHAFHPDNADIYRYVAALIRRCPTLRYLYLSDYMADEEQVLNGIFTAIMYHPTVAHLSLESFTVDSLSFIQMMEHLAMLERLQSLSLINCKFTDIGALYCAVKVSSLRSLIIILGHKSKDMATYHVTRLTELIRTRLRHLQLLVLDGMDIDVTAAQHLICCERLRALAITSVTLEPQVARMLDEYISILREISKCSY